MDAGLYYRVFLESIAIAWNYRINPTHDSSAMTFIFFFCFSFSEINSHSYKFVGRRYRSSLFSWRFSPAHRPDVVVYDTATRACCGLGWVLAGENKNENIDLNSFQTDKYLFSAVLINFIYLFII
jgi:hypothetical protein